MNRIDNKPETLILIVEDNIDNAQVIIDILKNKTYQFSLSTSAEDALDKLQSPDFKPNIIMLDLGLPGMSGEKMLEILTKKYSEIPVIITTGSDDPDTIVRCIKNGAFDYLVKPLNNVRTVTSVKNAINLQEIEKETRALKSELLQDKLKTPEAFSKIITNNQKMLSMFKYIEALAQTRQPVLIIGETGTGKELFAKAVHIASKRKGKFVPVNIAGIDDQLINDTLFGHVKGAFTGASVVRKGLIEAASDGTIFLDEIGDLSLASQIKLLRLLQENEYLPGGADEYKTSKARTVMATNQNLESLIQNNNFRTDLYYRLKAHCIYIPPLRERKDDLPLLLDFFLKEVSQEIGTEVPSYTDELLELLRSYSFPGNVREMRGMVYEAVVKCSNGKLNTKYFSDNIKSNIHNAILSKNNMDTLSAFFGSCSTLPTIDQVTFALIDEALLRSDNNKTSAAKLINMNRGTLRNRLDDYKK
ncbi:MAG: sigma-54 dependent transcriptional regulator [Victivallales bacterium]|nr:sigma-54 dependent transcriptional regulator [Victivallales bacterium]